MYRGIELSCPVCAVPLVPAETMLPVHGCESCGGAWLGPEAAIKVMQGEVDEVETETIDAAGAVRVSHPSPPVPGMRCCAQCQQPMTSFRVGIVELEMCPAHGTWFDANEVSRVAQISHAHKDKVPPIATAEQVTGAVSIIFGALILPFRALFDVVESFNARRNRSYFD